MGRRTTTQLPSLLHSDDDKEDTHVQERTDVDKNDNDDNAAALWPDSAASSDANACTLFVRNLAFTVDDAALSAMFAEYGPIKRAFVVVRRRTKVSRGYGFVRFALAGDADRALAAMNGREIDGRALTVDRAVPDKAEYKPEQKRHITLSEKKATDTSVLPVASVSSPLVSEEEDDDDDGEAKKDTHWKRAEKPDVSSPTHVSTSTSIVVSSSVDSTPLRSRTSGSHVLLLSNLPLNVASIADHTQHLNGLQFTIFPSPESSDTYLAARLIFLSHSALAAAERELSSLQIKSVRTKLIRLEAENVKKLIVRNLPYNTTEQQIHDVFSAIGPLSSVHLPPQPLTTSAAAAKTKRALLRGKGFAFIIYDNILDAKRAIDELNGHEINARKVAVDWTLDKAHYLERRGADVKAIAEQKAKVEADRAEKLKMKAQRREENIANRERKRAERLSPKNESAANGSQATGESDAAADDDDDDVDQSLSASDSESDAHQFSDAEDNAAVVHGEVTKPPPRSTNARPENTVFIRNVSYDTTEEQLIDCFSTFGALNYAKIVVDSVLQRPKGTAFVQFRDADGVKAVLAKAAEGDAKADLLRPKTGQRELRHSYITSLSSNRGVVLNGRTLHVVPAVSRDSAHALENSEEAERRKDKRNTYLMHEGYIGRDSPAATLSAAELDKRETSQREKKKRLKRKLEEI